MPKINPRIKSIDDLLGLDAAEESPIEPTPSVSLPTKNTIITLPPQAIRAFRGHPFRLYEGDRLNDLVESISEHGVLNPAIIRKIERDEDGFEYEMLAGHNRQNAAAIANRELPCIVKENLSDMDTWMFFKWFFKAAVAIYLVTHTFDIVMAVFDIGQNVVSGAAGVIHGNTSIDIDSTIAQMRTGMENMGVGELLGLSIETLLISLCLKIMAILITVILYGRMIEIYCTVSIAPIPIATMSNREWGSIGTNYLKGLFALAFQGFLIMVCVGIYAVLINGMIIADNIHSALFSVAAYTVILCFSLFKTGSLAKSIFHAH